MLTLIIQPQQISSQTIRNEIAKILHTAVHNIKKFECWPHQIWVHIEGVGGRIISYRSLPTYLHQAILAVKNCQTIEQLQELGRIFKLETQRFPQYYAQEFLNKLRKAWGEKHNHLIEKEEREAPMKKHQHDGQKYLESWQGVIANCETTDALEYLYPLIRQQGKKFEDLPEIIEQLLNSYQQRYQELGNSDGWEIRKLGN